MKISWLLGEFVCAWPAKGRMRGLVVAPARIWAHYLLWPTVNMWAERQPEGVDGSRRHSSDSEGTHGCRQNRTFVLYCVD